VPFFSYACLYSFKISMGDVMASTKLTWWQLETEEQRIERRAWTEAFWARPEAEVMRDLVFPEEERTQWTAVQWSGGFRWFESPNVICLERVRKGRRNDR
jgi:hypothetical protein